MNRIINYYTIDTVSSITYRTSTNLLIKESDLINQEFNYTKCPVFNHRTSRVFVGVSPIDFSFMIERKPSHPIKVHCDESISHLLVYDNEHLLSPHPVVQLKFPKHMFWTTDDDIWFEMYDHPITSYSNNFIAVSGWFNLSNWSRMSNLGMTIVDESKPVVIKKGDPLFRIAFHSQNPNDSFTLNEERNSNVISEVQGAYDKMYSQKQSEESVINRLFSKTDSKSKCPVSFLFK